jgi:hypothetical protein
MIGEVVDLTCKAPGPRASKCPQPACGLVALGGGCENLGEMTAGSTAAAVAAPATNGAANLADAPPLPAPAVVWVDDDVTARTRGWGYDHFDVPDAGLAAVAKGGTLYLYEGWDPEGLHASGVDCHIRVRGTVGCTAQPPAVYGGTNQVPDPGGQGNLSVDNPAAYSSWTNVAFSGAGLQLYPGAPGAPILLTLVPTNAVPVQ